MKLFEVVFRIIDVEISITLLAFLDVPPAVGKMAGELVRG